MKNKQSLTTTARQSWLDCALEDLTEGRSPAEVLESMIDELQEHKRILPKESRTPQISSPIGEP